MSDPETKLCVQSVRIEHLIANGRETKDIPEWLPNDTDPKSVALAIKPGTVVKVVVESLRTYLGVQQCRGVVSPLVTPEQIPVTPSHQLSLPVA